MYATAHRVVNPKGEEGVNAFLHRHGPDFPWPEEAWNLPETQPGDQVWEQVSLPPGGNRVRSYLDLLCPDDTRPAEVDVALTGLWLELVADDAAPAGPQSLPNPLVYQRDRVTVRFGVEEGPLVLGRALEMSTLRRLVDPATAPWTGVGRGSGESE